MITLVEKKCGRCQTEKPVEDFYKNRARHDGISNYCKKCEVAVSSPGRKTPEGRARARARARARRQSLIAELGGACSCCGEDTYEFLQFDHINNDGADHRRKLGKKALVTSDIRKMGLEHFQLLCANCNFAKGMHGKCVH